MIELYPSIMDFAESLEEQNYSGNTVRAYIQDLSQFHVFCQEYYALDIVPLKRIDRQTIQHFLGKLIEDGKNRSSIARKLAALKSFSQWTLHKKFITKDPTVTISAPKLDKTLPEYLSRNEISKLMETPDISTFVGCRDRAILELFYSAGLRIQELCSLTFNQVDFSNQLLRVKGKGNKERIVPFSEVAKKYVLQYMEFRKSQFQIKKYPGHSPLFVTIQNRLITTRQIRNRVTFYMKQVSEKAHISPHTLRHTFATHLLNNGADITAVKDLLGHSSLSTTQIYTHVNINQIKQIYRQAHPRSERCD